MSVLEPKAGTGIATLRSGNMTEEACARYFAEREILEREMSGRSSDERVAAAHKEMADRYEALAVVFGAKSTPDYPIH